MRQVREAEQTDTGRAGVTQEGAVFKGTGSLPRRLKHTVDSRVTGTQGTGTLKQRATFFCWLLEILRVA